MKLKIRLDTDEINHAIEEIEKYKNSIPTKTEMFISKLLDVGIWIAEVNSDEYGDYIEFQKEIKDGGKKCVGIFRGVNKKPYISEWDYFGKKKTAKVNMLLMAEFGSGWLSEVMFNISGVGVGTFPNQKHALDDNGWYWKEWQSNHKGQWHHSYGSAPTHPMYFAEMEMIQQIEYIAKSVFQT